MAKRRPTRMEALAVLRGEIEHHKGRRVGDPGRTPAITALQRAIDVLQGEAMPSAPSPGADPPNCAGADVDFIKGMMEGE